MIKTWLPHLTVILSLVGCTAPVNSTRSPATPGQTQRTSEPVSSPTPAPTAVKTLEIEEKNAEVLQQLESYAGLEVLSISCVEDLRALPDSIGHLRKLKELRIDNGNGCSMNPVLPETFGNLYSLETLVLYGAQDPRGPGPQPTERHKFPRSMSQLKNLAHLDLGRNGLREIPSFVKELPKLRQLKLEFNDLNDLPDFLNTLPNLTDITLGNNCEITGSEAKKKDLKRRFPKVEFNFTDEYECPSSN